jgi:hypothetical protein
MASPKTCAFLSIWLAISSLPLVSNAQAETAPPPVDCVATLETTDVYDLDLYCSLERLEGKGDGALTESYLPARSVLSLIGVKIGDAIQSITHSRMYDNPKIPAGEVTIIVLRDTKKVVLQKSILSSAQNPTVAKKRNDEREAVRQQFLDKIREAANFRSAP